MKTVTVAAKEFSGIRMVSENHRSLGVVGIGVATRRNNPDVYEITGQIPANLASRLPVIREELSSGARLPIDQVKLSVASA